MRPWRSGRFSPVLIGMLLLAGCGIDPASQDLCARYADLEAAVDELRAAPLPDPANTEEFEAQVDETRAKADKVRDTLDQVQRVSEGRLDTAIANARLSVNEMRESLIVARYDAAETLGPRITEAQEAVSAAYAPVAAALDAQCPDN